MLERICGERGGEAIVDRSVVDRGLGKSKVGEVGGCRSEREVN